MSTTDQATDRVAAGEIAQPARSIAQAGFQEILPAAPESGQESPDPQETFEPLPVVALADAPGVALQLSDVLQAVADCYPLIDAALAEIEAARGQVLASWGDFDSVLAGRSENKVLGFYQTYRNGIDLTRPLFGGGELFGGYRIGRGNFEPWFGERETNEAGEIKAGIAVPLARDRAIDQRRAELFAARWRQSEVESSVAARLLLLQRLASQSYWEWLAAGKVVATRQRLLELALERAEQIAQRVDAGDLPQLAQIDNDRFVAARSVELIKARRSFEKAAIKLSLFNRDGNCCPKIAGAEQLPDRLADSTSLTDDDVDAAIAQAIALRPEMAELNALARQTSIALRYARNLTLPELDLKGTASQDLGQPTPSNDKTPFEMEVGLFGEVPLQRREGRGKMVRAQAKLAEINAKRQFESEKIAAEVQDAASGVNAAHMQIEQSRENLRLARQSLELGRLSFEEGDIGLIELNIYETAAADAELDLIFAQLNYFFFHANYETAIQGDAVF